MGVAGLNTAPALAKAYAHPYSIIEHPMFRGTYDFRYLVVVLALPVVTCGLFGSSLTTLPGFFRIVSFSTDFMIEYLWIENNKRGFYVGR